MATWTKTYNNWIKIKVTDYSYLYGNFANKSSFAFYFVTPHFLQIIRKLKYAWKLGQVPNNQVKYDGSNNLLEL